MKKIVCLLAFAGLLLLPCTTKADSQDSLKLLSLQGRIVNLELMEENLAKDLDLKKEELRQSNEQLGKNATTQFIFTIAALLLGSGSILGSYWVGVARAKKLIIERAERKIRAEVERKLPAILESEMKDKVIPEVKVFLGIAEKEKHNQMLKASVEIVVVGEDDSEVSAGMQLLQKHGYKHIKTCIPQEDVLPQAQVYFVHRRLKRTPEDYRLTSDSQLIRFIDRDIESINAGNAPSGFFFYIPEQNDRLGIKRASHDCLGFANDGQYVDERLLPLVSNVIAKAKP